MATQEFIILAENDVLAAMRQLRSALEAYTIECKANDGPIYPNNRDCWGTLRVNTKVMVAVANKFLLATDRHFA